MIFREQQGENHIYFFLLMLSRIKIIRDFECTKDYVDTGHGNFDEYYVYEIWEYQ